MIGKPIRILIADDDKNIRRLYEKEFRQAGYEVLLAEKGSEAVEKVRNENPDLVILDIRMPGMDGIEALGRILAIKNNIPVILNTAYTSYQNNFMSWAADAYVIKSPDLEPLRAKVREILVKKGLLPA
ncbi:MAG: response regulator [Acidobacteria bacterium]|nr:response regulator [Acidobacteriota bacterium]